MLAFCPGGYIRAACSWLLLDVPAARSGAHPAAIGAGWLGVSSAGASASWIESFFGSNRTRVVVTSARRREKRWLNRAEQQQQQGTGTALATPSGSLHTLKVPVSEVITRVRSKEGTALAQALTLYRAIYRPLRVCPGFGA
jgi:hypothetical protein